MDVVGWKLQYLEVRNSLKMHCIEQNYTKCTWTFFNTAHAEYFSNNIDYNNASSEASTSKYVATAHVKPVKTKVK